MTKEREVYKHTSLICMLMRVPFADWKTNRNVFVWIFKGIIVVVITKAKSKNLQGKSERKGFVLFKVKRMISWKWNKRRMKLNWCKKYWTILIYKDFTSLTIPFWQTHTQNTHSYKHANNKHFITHTHTYKHFITHTHKHTYKHTTSYK